MTNIKRSFGKILIRSGSALTATGLKLRPDGLRTGRVYISATGRTGRIYISGTGRAGTTFLVQLLTKLGCDTGFGGLNEAESKAASVYFSSARAGFERDIFDKSGPQIVKSPYLCDHLDAVLHAGIEIAHVIIPIRDFTSAAKSREYVQTETTGLADGSSVPGGLWDTERAASQENILRTKLANLVEACVRNDIPMTFLSFPRFAKDPDYVVKKLRFLFPQLTKEAFPEVFRSVARADLIHDFQSDGSWTSGSPSF
jgi:hypothetical protein